MKRPNFKHVLLAVLALFVYQSGFSCSMYKITLGGKTIVGCNEDAWRLTPHIWFENKVQSGSFGAAFTGSRFDGANGYAPQSGMNEFGLSFSRLAAHSPKNKPVVSGSRKAISNPTLYLKDILHTCKTVEEVKAYISQYDYSYFIEDVFIYIDKSGKYLVVEPYTLAIGDEPNYVLSNFCPSATPENAAFKLNRYRKGVEFLKYKTDTTLAFCTALSDTMHVCREKIGDGTLLTSIWDLYNGTVNLYFYHQYKNVVSFNLQDELAKGDHAISIQTLFPLNREFEKLGTYKIPQNSGFLRLFLALSGGLFLFSALFFSVSYFKARDRGKYAYAQVAQFPLGVVMFYYMYILCTDIYIFYFPSPYADPESLLVSATSYVPFLLLLLIIPFLFINRNILKEKTWGLFSKLLFTFNNLLYIILLGLFAYWGFFGVLD
jgi:hypothetical protein